MRHNLRTRAIQALRLSPLTVKQLSTMLSCCQHTMQKIMAGLLDEGFVWRELGRSKTHGRHAYVFHLNQMV